MVLDSFSITIGAIVSVLSIITFLGGILAYYRASVRKEYASERDMNHLQRNQLQLSQNIEQLWRLMDEKFDSMLAEIREALAEVDRNRK